MNTITLTKSFELQNYLKQLYNQCMGYLLNVDYLTMSTQEHMRSKVYKEAEDEEIIVPKNGIDIPVDELIKFTLYLQDCLINLRKSIHDGKHHYSDGDFDVLIANNSIRRELIDVFKRMMDIKENECIKKGYALKFNEAGEQTTYSYDIKETKTVDFDKASVKKILRDLRKVADEISDTIDVFKSRKDVEYDCIFQIGDNLEDSYQIWKEQGMPMTQRD